MADEIFTLESPVDYRNLVEQLRERELEFSDPWEGESPMSDLWWFDAVLARDPGMLFTLDEKLRIQELWQQLPGDPVRFPDLPLIG